MKTAQKEFIEKIAPIVQVHAKESGILASLTIAQAILESSWGNSALTKEANNLFGFKGRYKGQYCKMRTREVYAGKEVYVNAEFRKYNSWSDSIADHQRLLNTPNYKKVRGEVNYVKAAHAIKSAGYATDPHYPKLLINLIEQYKLNQYDEVEEDPYMMVNMSVNGSKPEPFAIHHENRAYIPAAFLVELGINVKWDNDKKLLSVWKEK